jgi:hypothetical protein
VNIFQMTNRTEKFIMKSHLISSYLDDHGETENKVFKISMVMRQIFKR